MKLLVSGCTKTLERMARLRPDRFGAMLTPDVGNSVEWAESFGVWACDNGCFNGLNRVRWLKMLAKIVDRKPIWVTCPDVVADAQATWRQWLVWSPVMREIGLPVAFVLQDGMELLKNRGPWSYELHNMACVFVGGSTEWKMSKHAERLIEEAKYAGKLVHVGRVNSFRRIQHFARIGVDTFDGSGFSKFGDARMHLAVRWIDTALGGPLFATDCHAIGTIRG